MKLSSPLAILALTAATGVSAATHLVKAIAQPSLQFQPNIIYAKAGDYLEFHFGPKNHSVAQGSFSSACAPTHDGGFFSGYFPVEEGESDKVFKVLVENEDPILFYCTQVYHCATGMFGLVNPNKENSGESYAALVSALKDKKAVEPAGGPFGGDLIDNPDLADPADPAAEDLPTTTSGGGGSFTSTTTTTTTITPSSSGGPKTTDDASDPKSSSGKATAPGPSKETDGSEGAGAVVGRAPAAGLAAVLGVAVLLA